jgi:hypothetical protein
MKFPWMVSVFDGLAVVQDPNMDRLPSPSSHDEAFLKNVLRFVVSIAIVFFEYEQMWQEGIF